MALIPEFTQEISEPSWRFDRIFDRYPCEDPQYAPGANAFLPCKRCKNCLIIKRIKWAKRTFEEKKKWPKAWFVTFTYRNTKDYSYEEVKKYLKRVRKTYKGRLSYIFTEEFKSSGERDWHPHHHGIVFGPGDLNWDNLDLKWQLGHSKCKLLDSRDIWYVAKYIGKDYARVRASQSYGIHNTKNCQIMKNPSLLDGVERSTHLKNLFLEKGSKNPNDAPNPRLTSQKSNLQVCAYQRGRSPQKLVKRGRL